jgi:hypothetical protein
MTAPQIPWAPPPSRWRRKLLIVIGCVLVLLAPILAIVGTILYNRHRGAEALEQARTDADRQDPQWRLPDIEKRRTALPEAENGARPILDAVKLMPPNWPDPKINDSLDLLPPYQLDNDSLEMLRREMKLVEPALAKAHEATKFTKGWFAVPWSPDAIGTRLEHLQKLRGVANMLQLDALVRNQDGDHAGAWKSSLAILALCRALGEEPTMVSQLVRIALRGVTHICLERTLAQGSVDDAALMEGQRLLTAEANEPLLLYALRGERALMDHLLTNLENGGVDESRLGELQPGHHAQYWINGGTYQHDHAWLLNHYTRAIEIAGGSVWEIHSGLAALEPKKGETPPLAALLASAVVKVADAWLRNKAQLECAVAGLGVERFRLQHQRWPDSLEEVVAAKLLDKVPADVFDGKPLRYRKWKNGAVVYSVGPDRKYGGDALDALTGSEVDLVRYEFRLWDPSQRRQPPRPRPNEDEPRIDPDAKK